MTIHQSTVTRDSSALRCESRLYPVENDNGHIIHVYSSQLTKALTHNFSQAVFSWETGEISL